jgi:hypothetical protein
VDHLNRESSGLEHLPESTRELLFGDELSDRCSLEEEGHGNDWSMAFIRVHLKSLDYVPVTYRTSRNPNRVWNSLMVWALSFQITCGTSR